jgi:two-component system, cell cycle sensor histidine kinase and response regulator CckA
MHPRDLPRFPQHIAALAQLPHGEKAFFEYRVHAADGSWKWFISTDMVFRRNPDGSIAQIIGSALDVTEIRESMLALSRSEQQFRQLADSMPQLVWTAQADGTVDYYNQKYMDFQGIAIEGESWQWSPVLHPEDRDTNPNSLAAGGRKWHSL